ncbi:MAG: hypothetical protein U0575_16290 [Phycisphaerales bacterium]
MIHQMSNAFSARRNALRRSAAIAIVATPVALLGLVACDSGWQTDPNASAAAKSTASNALEAQAQATIDAFRARDPSIDPFLRSAYAYAVFPTIGKGGFIVGGGGGDGVVFRNGVKVGTASVGFASLGAIAGGQTFSEIVAFQTEAAFNQFKSNQLEFAAGASAVAATAGAAASANYAAGVAVFTMSGAGLMIDASIGGQKFRFTPVG